MDIHTLRPSLRDPIIRKVAFLVLVFATTLGLVVIALHVAQIHRVQSDGRLRNMHVKGLLGDIILKQLLQMELDIHKVAEVPGPEDSARDVASRDPRHRFAARVENIKDALAVLSQGGEYATGAHCGADDDLDGCLVYWPDVAEEAAGDVAALATTLSELERAFAALDQLARQQSSDLADGERAALAERVGTQRVLAETTLQQALTDASQIHRDAGQKLALLQRQNAAGAARMQRVTSITVILLLPLAAASTWILLRQIAQIVAERWKVLGDLRRYSDHLDGVVRERTNKLERLTRQHQLILNSAGEGIFGLDEHGNVTFVNPAAARMLGYDVEDLLGRQHHAMVHHTHANGQPYPQEDCPIHATLRDGVSHVVVDDVFWRKDGTCFPVKCISTPILEGGRVVGAAVTCQDVTDSRRADRALRVSEERFRTILNSIQAGIVLIDAETRTIVEANPAALAMVGVTKDEAVGRVCHAFLCPAQRDRCPVMDLGQRVDISERVLLRVGAPPIPILKSVTPVVLDDRLHLLESFIDISDRKRAEEQLRIAKELAEAATEAKSNFLANMSHEIRTPMSAILGFADILLEHGMRRETPAEWSEAAQTIKRNGEYLLQIINDILDLSKIEAGRMRIDRVHCSPCRVVADVASLMRVRADAKGLPFIVEYDGSVPESVQTDPARLRQVLVNICANAIKFTESGSVRLVTSLVDVDGEPRLRFDIVDTGLGMAPEQVAALFQPFTQGDASTTRTHGGTGLGLAISKRLAEGLGGDIGVADTTLGAGTRFRITVAAGPLDGVPMIDDPLSATTVAHEQRDPVSERAVSRLEGCRILLAEDGPDNQRLITRLLEKAGANVTVVANGRLAVDAALAAVEAKTPFDVILMDMQMPVMGGYEAAGELRRQGYAGAIVALTAHAMSTDRAKCLQAGCDEYAAKPINRGRLLETIHTVTLGRTTMPTP